MEPRKKKGEYDTITSPIKEKGVFNDQKKKRKILLKQDHKDIFLLRLYNRLFQFYLAPLNSYNWIKGQ